MGTIVFLAGMTGSFVLALGLSKLSIWIVMWWMSGAKPPETWGIRTACRAARAATVNVGDGG